MVRNISAEEATQAGINLLEEVDGRGVRQDLPSWETWERRRPKGGEDLDFEI